MTTTEVHVHIHVDGPAPEGLQVHVTIPPDTQLEGLLMATKEEVLAALDTLTSTLTELAHDVTRLAEELEAAIQANDLTAVAGKVADLQAMAAAIDAAVEVASPEPEPEPEPTP